MPRNKGKQLCDVLEQRVATWGWSGLVMCSVAMVTSGMAFPRTPFLGWFQLELAKRSAHVTAEGRRDIVSITFFWTVCSPMYWWTNTEGLSEFWYISPQLHSRAAAHQQSSGSRATGRYTELVASHNSSFTASRRWWLGGGREYEQWKGNKFKTCSRARLGRTCWWVRRRVWHKGVFALSKITDVWGHFLG